jgi:substrate import-associated zinc metallohydrolase lipoprotein
MKMKRKILYYTCTVWILSFCFLSCSNEELDSTSKIVDSQKEENEFDRWILNNYVLPYNIDFKYRMEDIESDMNYQLVPADYNQSVRMAKLMKYLCLEAYDVITGSKDFIRSYYPKMVHLVGSAAYRNNGTMILGTAEGGLKITMYYVNELKLDIGFLNHYYFKTMHHEFGHILNQKKPYSTDFDLISGSKYVNDSWNTAYTSDAAAQKDGFISPYAASESKEDFVELFSIYVTSTAAEWNQKLTAAGTGGASLINQKFEIVYNYMLNSWDIDLNELRAVIQERQNNLSTLDLNTLN